MAGQAHGTATLNKPLNRILVCCGAGVSTSMLVCEKLKTLLDAEGFAGTYVIDNCRATEAAALSQDYTLLVSTTGEPEGLACPFVNGIPFLNGRGEGAAEAHVLSYLA